MARRRCARKGARKRKKVIRKGGKRYYRAGKSGLVRLKGGKKPQRLVGKEQRLAEGVSEVPAANLLLSILQCSGLEIGRFGSSTGSLTGLEWS